ncbi:MAG: FkbM family methyltransferase [Acidobacteriota bacterium]
MGNQSLVKRAAPEGGQRRAAGSRARGLRATIGRAVLGPRLDELECELDHQRQVSAAWKAKARDLKAEVQEKAHAVLSPDVLRLLLPGRLERARHLSAMPDARARHEAHMRGCLPYREAILAERVPSERAAPATIEGVRWWVPMDPRYPDRLSRVVGQGLPLRILLRTREIALGGSMIDIGANIGRTSIPRVVMGDVSLAYAAEPDPDNFACLARTVADNGLLGLVMPEHTAVGSTDGEIELTHARFIGGHAIRPASRRGAETTRVPVRRLDTWVRERAIDLDLLTFVKVDVQGWEPHVLLGAPQVLAKAHVSWQLEVDPGQLEAAGGSAEDLFALIEQSFGHFIDLHPDVRGPRVLPVSRLRETLGYLGDKSHKTDLVLIHG